MARLTVSRVATTLPILVASASCVPSPAVGPAAPAAVASVEAATGPGFSFFEAPPPSSLGALGPADEARWNKAGGLFTAPSAAPAAPFALDGAEGDRRRAIDCLTAAVYHEARSEGADGQRAVAQVVLNRVRHPAFPSTVCGVVYQGSGRRTGCQFSFTCDGSLGRRREGHAWTRAREIAPAALGGEVYAAVGNATHYHTRAILPYWASSLRRSATVGEHIFYRWRGGAGRARAFSQDHRGEPGAKTPRAALARAAAPAEPKASPKPAHLPVAVERVRVDGATIVIRRGGPPPGEVQAGVRIHAGLPDFAQAGL